MRRRDSATCMQEKDGGRMAEHAESDTLLVQKKGTKSIVWKYFGLKAGDGGLAVRGEEERPVCKTCNRRVQCKGGNTTNLFAHLRDGHPELYKEAMETRLDGSKGKRKETNQPKIASVIARGTQYHPKSAQAQELNRAVAYFLAKDMQPYFTVEREGFLKMVSKLNPRYKVPSRKYFTEQEMPRLYNSVKETVVKPKLLEIHCYDRLMGKPGNPSIP